VCRGSAARREYSGGDSSLEARRRAAEVTRTGKKQSKHGKMLQRDEGRRRSKNGSNNAEMVRWKRERERVCVCM